MKSYTNNGATDAPVRTIYPSPKKKAARAINVSYVPENSGLKKTMTLSYLNA
jgi:hypothetical protein